MKIIMPSVKVVALSSTILFTIAGCDTSENSSRNAISSSIPSSDINLPSTSVAGSIPAIEDSAETSSSDTIDATLASTEINTEDSISSKKELVLDTTSFEISKDDTSSAMTNTEFAKPDADTSLEGQVGRDQFLAKLLEDYPSVNYANVELNEDEKADVKKFCQRIDARLSSVSFSACMESNHKISPFKSVNGTSILVTEFAPKENKKPLGRVLIIGGTHGDELTSVSTSYQWINKLNKFHSGLFHWHIAPVINPDGVLIKPATRTNANGIDINRNLPTTDWDKQSKLRWSKTGKNARRNPGLAAASEPETQWIMHEIETFKPDAIVSIHAPYGILDFDSPQLKLAPSKFGRLKLNLLGTYPGSLGNYAGIEKGIPVLTLELPNALYMPPQKEIDAIWSDMIRWLRKRLSDKN